MLKSPGFELKGLFFACGGNIGPNEDPITQFFEFQTDSRYNGGWYLNEKAKMLKLPVFKLDG